MSRKSIPVGSRVKKDFIIHKKDFIISESDPRMFKNVRGKKVVDVALDKLDKQLAPTEGKKSLMKMLTPVISKPAKSDATVPMIYHVEVKTSPRSKAQVVDVDPIEFHKFVKTGKFTSKTLGATRLERANQLHDYLSIRDHSKWQIVVDWWLEATSFTDAEIVAIKRAARQAWDVMADDLFNCTGQSVMTRDEVIECVLDAGYMQSNGGLSSELMRKVDVASDYIILPLMKSIFTSARYVK